ncbi:MAG TPA: phosphate ABC transporter substrate-binding protein PstS [Haliangiales bacterium]|nr:phosphate ABC transporter substrate-binding protein PstS [Haliangiales bacterium]
MRVTAIPFLAALALGAGCEKSEGPVKKEPSPTVKETSPTPEKAKTIALTGAGATFPAPLYIKWVSEYHKAHADVEINYQSIGSGGGIKQITEKTVDFGASDAPMKDDELAKASAKLVHVPMTIGAVVLAYNVPDVPQGLKLSRKALVGIYLGTIKKWNDPEIAKPNPGAKLPDSDISVTYRSDGSGTTAVFTSFLSKASPEWKEKVGEGKAVKFPVGMGGKGNEGVAGQVKSTPGAIGYVELAYAKQTGLTYGVVENAAGKLVEPSLDSVSAAAAALADKMPDDLRAWIVDAPGDASYPISSFTFIMVYEDMADATKGKALAQFLWWAVHDGQKLGGALDYAPLPADVVTKVEAKLKGLKAQGQALL